MQHGMGLVRALAGLMLAWPLVVTVAHAQGANAPLAGSSGGPAASAPAVTAPAVVVDCKKPTSARLPAGKPISVTVNAATAWQPRGGEVIVAVEGDGTNFANLSFLACFGWSEASAGDYFSEANLSKTHWLNGFVVTRPSNTAGLLNLGVIVPPLPGAPSSFIQRWFSGARSTGSGLVPVADVRLIAYTKDGVLFDEVRPIGITSVPFAMLVAIAALVGGVLTLYRFATGRPPMPAAAHGSRLQASAAALKKAASPDWILTLIRTPDGRASLSAFQILLWTLVVAVSAMYVMTLSGNLINVTEGTLTLLGIAGAAGLIAGFSTPPTASPVAVVAADPAQPVVVVAPVATPMTTPKWADLISDPATGTPDISRVQMLFFTVVSAGFVIVQVLNYYVIPDIPAGYQILMGISNGVYVGRKFKP